MAENNNTTNGAISKEWMDEYDRGLKDKALLPMRVRMARQTLAAAPTAGTLTYTVDGKEYDFRIGDEVRVPDAENAADGANGYVYYKLYDLVTDAETGVKTAYWALGGSGTGGGATGKIKVYLKDIINDLENASPNFAGVKVTLTNTTDKATFGEKTLAAGETAVTFTKVTPLKDYEVSVTALDTSHTAPAKQAITNLGIGEEKELTFRYEADEYTIATESNYTDKTDIDSAKVTVLGAQYGAGDKVKVAKGTDIGTPTASDVAGYAKSVSVGGKTITATYQTTLVSLSVVSNQADFTQQLACSVNGMAVTVTADGTATVESEAVKVPTGAALTIVTPDVTHYKKTTGSYTVATGTEQVIGVEYLATKVTVGMTADDTEGNAAPQDARARVSYTPEGATDAVEQTLESGGTALVPTGQVFRIDFLMASGYGSPASHTNQTATGTQMSYTEGNEYVAGALTINLAATVNGSTAQLPAGAKAYYKVGDGEWTEYGGTVGVQPGSTVQVKYEAMEGYTTPAETGAFTKESGVTTLTATYESVTHTVQITSNQTNDTTIAAQRATLSYTYAGSNFSKSGLESGAVVNVPASGVTGLAVACDDVAGYAKSTSTVGTVHTVAYQTCKLTVTLTYDGETAPDLTGVTVTVRDTTDNKAIAKTGGVYLIPGGHGYSVAVSDDVEGYAAPSAQTGTAGSGTNAAATVTMTYEEAAGFVDLGLPSGLKWAQGNIVKQDGKYVVGEETDYGAYVSWGNVEPHFSANGSTFDDGYDWGSDNTGPYASTPGAKIAFTKAGEGFSANSGYDAARELLGGKWRMPTTDEFKELNDNCTSAWVNNYNGTGVNGRLFTSKNNGAKLFFPAAGYGNTSSLNRRGSFGYYWSSSLYSSDYGYSLDFNSSNVYPQNGYARCYGFSVRAVQ